MSEPGPGHNLAKDRLKSIVERVERVNEEIAEKQEDVKDIFREAKGNGYCVKTLRKVIALRKQDPNERAEAATILESYMNALGMLA